MSNIRNRGGNRAFMGLMLVGIGAVLLIRNMDILFLPEWLFTWPMLLILIGIYSAVKNGFRNCSWIIWIGIGVFFLLDKFVPGITNEAFFWPVVIMALGILFILRPKKKHWTHYGKDLEKDNFDKSGFTVVPTDTADIADTSDDFIQASSIFSGVNRKILSKNFQGGSITCVFGGAEIDMTQADIKGRVVIRIDQVFGGIKLKVPPDWMVQNEINGVFHGVEEKRNPQSFAVDPSKTLVLKGDCVFAGLEIRSY